MIVKKWWLFEVVYFEIKRCWILTSECVHLTWDIFLCIQFELLIERLIKMNWLAISLQTRDFYNNRAKDYNFSRFSDHMLRIFTKVIFLKKSRRCYTFDIFIDTDRVTGPLIYRNDNLFILLNKRKQTIHSCIIVIFYYLTANFVYNVMSKICLILINCTSMSCLLTLILPISKINCDVIDENYILYSEI